MNWRLTLSKIAGAVLAYFVAAAFVMFGLDLAHGTNAAIPALGFWTCFWLTLVVETLLRAHDAVAEMENVR